VNSIESSAVTSTHGGTFFVVNLLLWSAGVVVGKGVSIGAATKFESFWSISFIFEHVCTAFLYRLSGVRLS
jgi:hypothetical protein